MINRYQGNSGRLTHYPESERPRRPVPQKPAPSAPERLRPDSQGLHNGLESLGRVLPEKIGTLETEDIILMLILYLMYRESGDQDLLIIMGAMFLL